MKKELFEAFLTTNEKRIYRYLMNLCANEQDALDVLQTVFIAVYQNLERIEDATALAYTYKIAHNKCMSFLKNKSRYISVDPVSFVNIPDTNVPAIEPDYHILNSAMAELPPKLAAVIQLQYYEKLSYKDISAQLGISVKAVESLLVRAKRILRKIILQGTDKL
ncbi:MAG: hypothetical protein CVU50_01820 [Candidatus Cloacimonetes bacterium HGW-Cloacimonetes-3]|jgi:RNA polymerase sigma-70 factor (ECF subfamily)|nr:MAG: hypothetical protein CVU50_01820 [Candidatus Cloacimonetes bacterium HGW-Cloacimonetes-3]